ncbi:hypothetical protein, partial [Nocardiopsis halotolerans]|uniref:hypothetical protein n=1 Tax=Nocardiopsis halotolerans TaxID=124252 RepID=UPI0019D386F7
MGEHRHQRSVVAARGGARLGLALDARLSVRRGSARVRGLLRLPERLLGLLGLAVGLLGVLLGRSVRGLGAGGLPVARLALFRLRSVRRRSTRLLAVGGLLPLPGLCGGALGRGETGLLLAVGGLSAGRMGVSGLGRVRGLGTRGLSVTRLRGGALRRSESGL